MIEVFKTNVTCAEKASNIVAALLELFPGSTINFDLEDCDKILRVEGSSCDPDFVIRELAQQGYLCEILE